MPEFPVQEASKRVDGLHDGVDVVSHGEDIIDKGVPFFGRKSAFFGRSFVVDFAVEVFNVYGHGF